MAEWLRLWTPDQMIVVPLTDEHVFFLCPIFSSPEPKAHWWTYRIGRPSLTVVRRQHFQTSLKSLGKLKLNFTWRLHGKGQRNFVQTVVVTWPRKPPCTHMVKTLKSLLFRNQKADDLETRPTKFVQMMTLGWPWPILRQGQIWSIMLLYEKKVKKKKNGFFKNYCSLWCQSW